MARSFPPADAGITRLFFLFFCFFLSSTTALFIADRSALKLELASSSSSSSIPDRLPDRQPPELRARRDSCPSDSFSCGSSVPSNFCCGGSKSETTCMVLASNTTALCCPADSDCDIIQPITCNITNQDHSLFPDSPIMTSALSHDLPRCGDACCPFGYTCNDSKECVLSSNQSDYGYLLDDSTEPVTTSASSATTASATATASGTVLQGTSPPSIIPASASATSTATPKNKSGSTSGLVAVCTIVSICCAVGLGTFIWVTRNRKRAKQEKQAREDFLLREAKEKKAPSPGSSFVTEDDDSTWEALKMTPSPGKPSPGPRRFNVRRGANDRLAAIPESQYYSPGSFAVHNPVMSPVELPASPVSFCMWQNLELAEVQEPKLAYIVPAKQEL